GADHPIGGGVVPEAVLEPHPELDEINEARGNLRRQLVVGLGGQRVRAAHHHQTEVGGVLAPVAVAVSDRQLAGAVHQRHVVGAAGGGGFVEGHREAALGIGDDIPVGEGGDGVPPAQLAIRRQGDVDVHLGGGVVPKAASQLIAPGAIKGGDPVDVVRVVD